MDPVRRASGSDIGGGEFFRTVEQRKGIAHFDVRAGCQLNPVAADFQACYPHCGRKHSANFQNVRKYIVADRGIFFSYARMPAIQIGAKYHHPDARELALAIIADNTASVQYKMSAIAVLGSVGQLEDADLLATHVKGAEVRLRIAAAGSMRRLGISH